MKFNDLINFLKKGNAELKEFSQAKNPDISSGASIDKAQKEQITFLEKGNILYKELKRTNADAVLLPPENDLIDLAKAKGLSWAVFQEPKLAFAECLEILNPRHKPHLGVHPSAIIEKEVIIEDNVSIGANVFIGQSSKINANTIIHPGVVIYEDVIIGESSEIFANAVIHSQSKLGKNCVVQSNSVIGSEGFGFIPTPNGWRKMPQTGFVIIEDNVEIGSGTTVDRPSVGITKIGAGTKIDNLVQIGHGVEIGNDCAFASQVGIAGGAIIGNNVILAGQVGVGNRAKIGNGVIASSKSGLHTDVPAGEVVSGFPAMPNRLWLKCSAIFSKLPEITKAVKELKRESSS